MNEKDLVKKIAHAVAKARYQAIYGWTDEQVETFWNNPKSNFFNKDEYLEAAKVALDVILQYQKEQNNDNS